MTSSRLSQDLDIVKIIRSLRDLKILMKNSLMSKNMKLQIRHSGKNLINLYSEEDESDPIEEEQLVSENDKTSTTIDPNQIQKNIL